MTALLAIDTETRLIAPGRAAPRMVCTTWAKRKKQGIIHVDDAFAYWRKWLTAAAAGRLTITNVTIHYDMCVVLATYPKLARLVFAAYERGSIRCSTLDQRLIDISNGTLESKLRPRETRYYNLKALAKRRLGKHREKGDDTWRLRYEELEQLPLSKWPQDAIDYAIDDARDAYDICQDIEDSEDAERLRDNAQQAYAAFALYLMTCRGIRTDGRAVQRLIDGLESAIAEAEALLWKHGLLKKNTKGKVTKNVTKARELLQASLPRKIRKKLKAAIGAAKAFSSKQARESRQRVLTWHGLEESELFKAQRRLDRLRTKDLSNKELMRRWQDYGYSEKLYVDISMLVRKPRPFKALGVELSKTGLVSVKANACKASQKPELVAYALYTSANTLRAKAQRLLKGSVIPLQTSYQACINSGRTSSRKSDSPLVGDNFQNFARSAMQLGADAEELPGVRECIIPRPGYVFCSIDFNAAEMRSYAQIEYSHLGVSELREVLNAGKNPHRVLGAYILGISEKQFELRYSAGDEECIRAAQFAKIPNFALLGGGGYKILPDYAAGMGVKLDLDRAKELYDAFHARWSHVSEMHKHFKTFIHKVYEHPYSRRLRYIDRYAQACNNPFQGLTADAAKLAVCRLAREQYVPGGQLWGSYSVLFLHDEVLFELQESLASEHAHRATKIMVDAYNVFTPDVPMTAEPALMRRFTKGAKTVYHDKKLDTDGNRQLIIYEAA
jgi:DNA polymerase I-like protein with 3'-5' exonuclease and polymerase domains